MRPGAAGGQPTGPPMGRASRSGRHSSLFWRCHRKASAPSRRGGEGASAPARWRPERRRPAGGDAARRGRHPTNRPIDGAGKPGRAPSQGIGAQQAWRRRGQRSGPTAAGPAPPGGGRCGQARQAVTQPAHRRGGRAAAGAVARHRRSVAVEAKGPALQPDSSRSGGARRGAMRPGAAGRHSTGPPRRGAMRPGAAGRHSTGPPTGRACRGGRRRKASALSSRGGAGTSALARWWSRLRHNR